MPTNFQEILTGFEPQKRSKTPQKLPFCPFFDTQEVVLGENSFGGANESQIQKFHLCWKVDRKSFPTSPLGANLDTDKAFKIGSKRVLRIEKSGAAHWGFLLILDSITLFFA